MANVQLDLRNESVARVNDVTSHPPSLLRVLTRIDLCNRLTTVIYILELDTRLTDSYVTSSIPARLCAAICVL